MKEPATLHRNHPGPEPAGFRASVVIPTHNRRPILERVLGFYAAQTEPRDHFELVVADDGSTDDTPALFRCLPEADPGEIGGAAGRVLEYRRGWFREQTVQAASQPQTLFVRYVRITKSGRSAARNTAIGAACARLIVFADDDVFVEPRFIASHLQAHRSGERKVVMGRVINTPDLDDPLAAKWKPKDINTAFLSTGNASVPKDLLIEAGLFDERYTVYGWEDFDLGVHLARLGVRSEKRKIYGYHYDPPAGDILPARVYAKEKERGQSAVYFYRSHPLPWVKRFTLVRSRLLKAVFRVLGSGNWFLEKERIRRFKGAALLIVRYKGYFDGIREALEQGCDNPGSTKSAEGAR
jgi:GT2 family glycosyltransferase